MPCVGGCALRGVRGLRAPPASVAGVHAWQLRGSLRIIVRLLGAPPEHPAEHPLGGDIPLAGSALRESSDATVELPGNALVRNVGVLRNRAISRSFVMELFV